MDYFTAYFPLLEVNNIYNSYKEFEAMFRHYKELFSVGYSIVRTRYIATDSRYNDKEYNPEVVYSEYHKQCKGSAFNLQTGYV